MNQESQVFKVLMTVSMMLSVAHLMILITEKLAPKKESQKQKTT